MYNKNKNEKYILNSNYLDRNLDANSLKISSMDSRLNEKLIIVNNYTLNVIN